MLYGSETWCLRENEVAISIKSTKIYGEGNAQCKVGDKRNTMELMDMLELKEVTYKLEKANSVGWYDQVVIF